MGKQLTVARLSDAIASSLLSLGQSATQLRSLSSDNSPSRSALPESPAGSASPSRILEGLLTTITDFIFLFDREGRFTFANQPLLELWGLTLAEAIGKNLYDLGYPKDLADKLHSQVEQVFITGQPIRDETFYTSPTGTSGIYEYRYIPLLGSDGSVQSVVGSAHDITDYKNIETTLRKSEEKYRTLFESLDSGCTLQEIIYDENGQAVDFYYVEANPAALRIAGVEKMVGQRAKSLFPGLEDYWIQMCDRVATTGISEHQEQYAAPLQSIYDVYLSKVGKADSRKIVSIFTDITERKQTEKLLERTAKLNTFRVMLSDALRPLSDPLEIQAVGNQIFGSYLNVSRAFYFEVTGTSRKYFSVAGGGYTDGVEIVPPGDYPAESYSPEVYERLARGETVVVSDVSAEPYLTEEQLAAYAHFDIAAFISVPLLKNGTFVAALSVNMNQPRMWTSEEITIAEEMTERTWATVERARTESAMTSDLENMRLLRNLGARSIAENSVQVLYGEIVETAIALTGATGGTLQRLDSDTQELLLLASRGFPQHMIDRLHRIDAGAYTFCGVALTAGENTAFPEANRTYVNFEPAANSPEPNSPEPNPPEPNSPDEATQLHLEAGFLCAQSTPLVSRKGNLIGMVSTYWSTQQHPDPRELRFIDLLARQAADLIEQRQADDLREQLLAREQNARQAAEQMNRVKDNFLAVLSHELRTPLNPIVVWSQLLLSKPLNEATTQKAYEAIQRNAKLQIQLIDDLLDVAKILRGKLEIEESPVSLKEVIRAGVEVVRVSAEAKSISLQLNLLGDYRVRGNDARLQQVIWNLLSNAIKFTPSGGRIEVQLTADNNRAVVTVTDTGKGIRPEFLPHLFESFQQEDNSITRQYGGLGLGLSIVKYIVNAHGGTITASSPGEGKGATFTVKLPLLNNQSVSSPSADLNSEKVDLAGIRVLAVDDNKDACELLRFLLEMYGAKVKVVTSGTDFLASFEAFNPDILLCDIAMPDIDGYTLLQRVRALPSQQESRTPVIALTAHAQAEDRQRVLESGFQQHIAKPIEPEALVTAILRWKR